jgi:hypothetical protein
MWEVEERGKEEEREVSKVMERGGGGCGGTQERGEQERGRKNGRGGTRANGRESKDGDLPRAP